MPLLAQSFAEPGHRSLVVLLHAYRHTPDRLKWVRQAVCEFMPDAHVIAPGLPLQMWSTADLNQVAADVITLIDEQVDYCVAQHGRAFDTITLVGHSTGSMVARKAYVIAYGETSEAPFEHRDPQVARPLHPRKPWVDKVTRVVQLAGMNGGWSVSHHMGLRRALEFTMGSAAGHVILSATGRRLSIFQIRRGAPFLSALRLQWLAMQKDAVKAGRATAMVVQLLGTVDDLVSPDDNLDLVTGGDFLYLDVPGSGHVNVIEMDVSEAGAARRGVFKVALTGSLEQITRDSVEPSDHDEMVRQNAAGVTDVVFVIHGIRDTGFWTHKIARRVQAEGRRCIPPRVYATETSTYGYFPMLSFLLPWRRSDKVAWLMDQYARAKSSYPDARISYLGHSNGTYLLASALNDNPACRFERVVFAGSVVRQDYDWARAARRGQVEAVLNYVATNDKIVACFPGALERLSWQDLGSAGHNGFVQARHPPSDLHMLEIRFVDGGHGAALSERQWDDIARFICRGQAPNAENRATTQTRSARFLGDYPWIVWGVIVAVLAGATSAIWQIPAAGVRTLALVAFTWVVVKILTRF